MNAWPGNLIILILIRIISKEKEIGSTLICLSICHSLHSYFFYGETCTYGGNSTGGPGFYGLHGTFPQLL